MIKLSTKQKDAAAMVFAGQNVFVTGSGGVGKSELLRHIVTDIYPKAQVIAPTGVAAVNVDGRTMHSFFGWGIDEMTNKQKLLRALNSKKFMNVIHTLPCLIIDEVSMVDAATLNSIDYVLRGVLKSGEPFGGLQMVLFGDFLQLPFIEKPGDAPKYHAFDSRAWRDAAFRIFELTQIFRQSDVEFITHLQAVRRGRVTAETIKFFSRFIRRPESTDLVTEIHTHRYMVDRRNAYALEQLPGTERTYMSEDYNKKAMSGCLAPAELTIKPGARVMMLMNYDTDIGIANGSIGVVDKMLDDHIVCTFGRHTVPVKTHTWHVKAGIKIIATRRQYPLTLAYATTMHKAQGLNMDAAYIDARKVFAKHQTYLGLSRVRTVEGLYLSDFTKEMVQVDARALKLYDLIEASGDNSEGYILPTTQDLNKYGAQPK